MERTLRAANVAHPMTVTCPQCETRYQMPPRSRLQSRPSLRCTRCDHVFDPEEGLEAPSLDAAEPEPEDERFQFDDPDDDVDAPPPAKSRRRKPPIVTKAPPPPPPEDDDADAEDDEDEPEVAMPPPPPRRAPARRARPTPVAEDFDDEDAEEDDEPEPAPPPRARKRAARDADGDEPAKSAGGSPARFALRCMLAVTLAYAVLSIYLYTHPRRVGEVLGGLPVVGQQLSDVRLSPASIQLTDLHGDYQRVHGDNLVFVVTGTAINNAPIAVSGVQIQARVHGPTELRQTVFCGAAPKDIRELSVREIDLLQTLTPPKDWTLPPGEQAPFLVAFVSPPVPLDDFTVEVVGVRRGGPAD